tara:strand:+ start:8555 stop:10018 length:1464 start_codon:yes stop_codon:yes gene_type:complete
MSSINIVKKKRGRKPKNQIINDLNSTESSNNSTNNSLADKEITININVPKKRGRKPKPKTDEVIKSSPKKRGRKPKIKTDPDVPKIPKKRGRKPKDKTAPISNITLNKATENDNIIIHLPINSKNLKKNMDSELLTYNPILEEPQPYEDSLNGSKIDNYQFISQKKNPNTNDPLTGEGPVPNTEYCQYPFDEKQKDIFEILEDLEDNKSTETINNINQLDEEYNIVHIDNWHKNNYNKSPKEDTVAHIIDNIKTKRDLDKSAFSSKTSTSNVEKCLIQLDESNKTSMWPQSTSIHCWWCAHSFDGPPCSLPCDYKDNIFKVLGIFCSPECAASYNFDDTQSGYDIWERYSLLNFLYKKIYNDNNIKIKLAPPKQTLHMFGGHLSIKDFRLNNINYNNTYKLVIPPLVSIIPIQELTSIDKGFSSNSEKQYYMLDKDKINDDKTLRLKRSKPFNSNKNTLEKCMLKSTTASQENDKESSIFSESQSNY